MVALDPPTVHYVPLAEATSRLKTVPLDCDTILTARDMGINFGDAMPLPDDPGELGRAVNALGGDGSAGRARSLIRPWHSSTVRIGVLGCGNVGAAFVGLVAAQAKEIEARTGVAAGGHPRRRAQPVPRPRRRAGARAC